MGWGGEVGPDTPPLMLPLGITQVAGWQRAPENDPFGSVFVLSRQHKRKERLGEKSLSFQHYTKRPQDEHCCKNTKTNSQKLKIIKK